MGSTFNSNNMHSKNSKDALKYYETREKKSRKKSRYIGLFIGISICVIIAVLIVWLLFVLLNDKTKKVEVTKNPNQMEKEILIDFSSIGINKPYSVLGKTEKRVVDEVLSMVTYNIVINNTNPDIDNYVLPDIQSKDVTLEPIANKDDKQNDNKKIETEGSKEEISVDNKYKNVIYVPQRDFFILPNVLTDSLKDYVHNVFAQNNTNDNKVINKDGRSSTLSGVHCDFKYNYEDKKGVIDKIVKDVATVWSTESSRGEITKYDNVRNEFVFAGDKKGYEVKQDELKSKIMEVLNSGNLDQIIDAPYNVILPQGENIKDKYRVISSFTTETSDNEIRNNNVNLAAKAINGKILKPNEEFSFNKAVGERTEAKGYGLAPAYAQGEVVEELGGGVCQVSSTLYNAVFCAGLKTTYRQSHTFEPAYVAPGLDATVSWNGADYKFVNTTGYPLGLKANYQKNKCTIEIFAVPVLEEGTTLSVSSTKIQDIDIPAPVVVEDEKEEKKGTKGSEWQVFKIIKKNGTIIEKVHDHYTKYKGHAPQLHQENYDKYLISSESMSIAQSIKESEEESKEKMKKESKMETKATKNANNKAKQTEETKLDKGGFFSPFAN